MQLLTLKKGQIVELQNVITNLEYRIIELNNNHHIEEEEEEEAGGEKKSNKKNDIFYQLIISFQLIIFYIFSFTSK